MNRRELMIATGGAILASTVGDAFAEGRKGVMEHGKHLMVSKVNTDIAVSAAECITTGEECVRVCIETMATGDPSMAQCARSLQALMSSCEALQIMAIHDSAFLKDIAVVAKKVCKDCQEECMKHKHHKQCIECANACVKCIELCNKYI